MQSVVKREGNLYESNLGLLKVLKKGIISMLLIALIVVSTIGLINGVAKFYHYNTLRTYNSLTFTKVKVSRGETAYSLQLKLLPDENIQELLFYSEKMNKRSLGVLSEGETIYLVSKINK